MGKIQHIAIATQDPEATARFYTEGLGLWQVGVVDSELAQGFYLTDGYLNIAILKFKTDAAATTEGAPRHAGIHHLGFKVDGLDEARAQLLGAGAIHRPMDGVPTMRPDGRANVEVKFQGPDGVTIDLSQEGWVSTS